MKKSTIVFAIAIASISFANCKKSSSGSGVCTINQIDYTTEFETGESNVSATVNYTGSELTSILPTPLKFEYAYSGGKVVMRKYYDGGILSYTDSVYYNGSGNIELIKGFRGISRVDSNVYQYGGSYLTKVHYYHQDSAHAGPLYHAFNDYSYKSGSIANVDRYDSYGKKYDSYSYVYGVKTNNLYRDNKNVQLYFESSFFATGEVFYDGFLKNGYLPESISYTDKTGTTTYTLTYDFNVYGYPTKVWANGVLVISFNYTC